jgi:hydrogenase maturation protease
VLGLGNDILRDDAVGLRALELARTRPGCAAPHPGVTFRELCIGGFDLLYEVEGYDALIVVDAYYSSTTTPGKVRFLGPEKLCAEAGPALSPHLLNLPAALELGSRLGYKMPELQAVIIIEVGDECHQFGHALTAPVAAAVPVAADYVCTTVNQFASDALVQPARID